MTDETDTVVSIPVDTVELEGELVVSEVVTGIVVFALEAAVVDIVRGITSSLTSYVPKEWQRSALVNR